MSNGLVPRAGLTLLLTSILGGVLVEPRAQNLEDVIPSGQRKFFVAIVTGQGEKVGFDEDRLAQDLQQGAEDARANDSRFELLPSNDENNMTKAPGKALDLRSDPRVLAVVGHMLSSTTRAAAEIYAEAGIPLLMPTATGVSAPYPANIPDDHSRQAFTERVSTSC
jgi:hypothetical protein